MTTQSITNSNSNSNLITPVAIGAGVGATFGVARAGIVQQASKSLLKKLGGIDTFERAKEVFNDKNLIEYKLVTNNLKTINISKDQIMQWAQKAFKTTGKTYAKNAAIFGAIGLAVGGAIALIKNSKQNKTEKQENNVNQ